LGPPWNDKKTNGLIGKNSYQTDHGKKKSKKIKKKVKKKEKG